MDFAEQQLGISLIPWQRWLLIHALELRPDRRFRFRTVLVLVARQNGKTSLVEIKNLWKMFVLAVPLVIGTAQNLDLAEESWGKAVEIIESIPELDAELASVDKTNGKKSFKLANGSRWKIATASRRGARGFPADDVNLDELREHLTWDSWAAVTKTTIARKNAQTWGYSNAGDNRSIVLNSVQAQGRATVAGIAESSTLGLFEWSVVDDLKCTCKRLDGQPHSTGCDLRDVNAWAQANPSLGYTITTEALASALDTDPEEIFRTECLCQRVPDLRGGAIDINQWLKLGDTESKRHGDIAVAVDISPKRDFAAIGLYGMRDDGNGHMQLVMHAPGTAWILPKLIEIRTALNPLAYGMGRGTYASLKTELALAEFELPEDLAEPERGQLAVTTATDMSAACGQLLDAVRDGTFRHVKQDPLDTAVAGAKTREGVDSIAWIRKDTKPNAGPPVDISPLVSVTVARWAYDSRAHLIEDYDVMDSFY